MTKRSVALVGILIVMAMIGSSVIGAVSAIAASDTANGSFSVFLPLIMNAIGAMAEVPQGAVMTFNLASCPSGWSEVTDAQGRALVGLPSGGTLGGIVGTDLTNLEDRTHYHYVNTPSAISSTSGSHTHEVDPPNSSTTLNGAHTHNIDPPSWATTSNAHQHEWVRFDSDEDWWTFDSNGDLTEMVSWGNGMDAAGENYYPIAVDYSSTAGYWPYYTAQNTHDHSVNLPVFPSWSNGSHDHTVNIGLFTSGAGGIHSHMVDIPVGTSETASTSDVMPYIQFLVCEKD